MKIALCPAESRLCTLADQWGVEEAALAELNRLETRQRIPRGMALALPTESAEEKKQTELYICMDSVGKVRWELLLPHFSYAARSAALEALTEGESEERKAFCALCRRYHTLPVLILRNLDGTGCYSPEGAHTLVRSEQEQTALEKRLLYLLDAEGWGGVNLDLQWLPPFDRECFSRFTARLGDVLHEKGLWLLITLPLGLGASPHSREHAAFDPGALGACSDRLILQGRGCVPVPIWRRELAWLGERTAPGKLIPYAWEGGVKYHRGKRLCSIPPEAAQNLAASLGSSVRRDYPGDGAVFSCTDGTGLHLQYCYGDILWGRAYLTLREQCGTAGIGCSSHGGGFVGERYWLQRELQAEELI